MSRIWSVILGCVAVLFNPIIPIYLSRSTWYDFDVGVAIILAAHLAFVRLGWLQTPQKPERIKSQKLSSEPPSGISTPMGTTKQKR